MELHRRAREWYGLEITTTPPTAATAWEASFDGGATWDAATAQTIDGVACAAWLVAGDQADPGTAVAVLSSSVSPLIRLTDNPEVVVRRPGRIYLTA